jgi:hypothetical protein
MKFSSVADDKNNWQFFSLKFKTTSFVTDKNVFHSVSPIVLAIFVLTIRFDLWLDKMYKAIKSIQQYRESIETLRTR